MPALLGMIVVAAASLAREGWMCPLGASHDTDCCCPEQHCVRCLPGPLAGHGLASISAVRRISRDQRWHAREVRPAALPRNMCNNIIPMYRWSADYPQPTSFMPEASPEPATVCIQPKSTAHFLAVPAHGALIGFSTKYRQWTSLYLATLAQMCSSLGRQHEATALPSTA